MSLTTENLKTSFEKADADKDGTLDAAELKAALADVKLEASEGLIQSFLHGPHLGHPNTIDFAEFEILVRYLESPAKSFKEGLAVLNGIAYALDILAKDGGVLFCAESSANIKIADNEAPKAAFNTSIAGFSGFFDHSDALKATLAKKIDSPVALVINVHVKNAGEIVGPINENLEAFKGVLSEISAEAKVILDLASFQAIETAHGVQIIIDLSKIPFVEAWAKRIHKPLAELYKNPTGLDFKLETTACTSNLEIPLTQLIKEVSSFELHTKNISPKNLLKIEELKAAFKKQLDTPDNIALVAAAFAIKTLNLEITSDHKIKNDLLNFLDVKGKNTSAEAALAGIEKTMADNGAYDFLELFDNAREVLRILHKNEASSAGVFFKLHDKYLGFQVKASTWSVLNRILKLEQ